MKRENIIPTIILIVVITALLVIDGITVFSKAVPVDYWCNKFPDSTITKTGFEKYMEINCNEYLHNKEYYMSYKELFEVRKQH